MNVPTRVRGRFARSVRVGSGSVDALDGYLPTARALDVVRRVVRGMASNEGSRAFSITGPYGSGKSSLAVFLDALCASEKSDAHRKAVDLLAEHDPTTADALADARKAMGVPATGMARAVVTAPQREPVAATVLRALDVATGTFRSTQQLRDQVADALRRAIDDKLATPSYREIRDIVEAVAAKRPLLVVIDEFGKNLEAYNDSGADGDMYLLQELAEWATATTDGVPMVLVTIQHLAFEAYAANASTAKRREWAKVQGRFEDIPYVDSASATRNLIGVALDHGGDTGFEYVRRDAAEKVAAEAAAVGLPEVASRDLLAACWPLHPSTLIVLPELCSRYGQNERTLFSFLASPEPLSVASWLSDHGDVDDLDWVRLDQVYDYFVESAGNFLAASSDGARWNEVSTAIRDAHGLTEPQRRVLKTVGVLNLVAATGMLRASRGLVAFACADGQDGTADTADVGARLDELEDVGLVTFRDYASEYRIWRGSDFDINAALRVARRSAQELSTARLLADVRPMQPLVAARHSTRTGTVRAFDRVYIDRSTGDVKPPPPRSVCDGLLLYRLDDTAPSLVGDTRVPAVTVDADPDDLHAVVEAAVEVAALTEVESDPTLSRDDQAARREVAERTAHARLNLDRLVAAAFDDQATWTWINPPEGDPERLDRGVATARLSNVLDRAYAEGPTEIAYEAINRAELTSAGARGRRIVQAALVDPATHRLPCLGLEGDGAEVAIYRAVLEDSLIHDGTSVARLTAPPERTGWRNVWDATLAQMTNSDAPVTAEHLLNVMMSPPYGLREGTASLFLTALLVVEAANLAVYEHGTFTPRLTAPVVERLVRNPRNFAFKHLGTAKRGRRWQVVKAIHKAFDDVGLGDAPDTITALSTVQRIAGVFRAGHSTYASKTHQFAGPDDAHPRTVELATAVRDAVAEAREPDVLLFAALPAAVGLQPVRGGAGGLSADEVDVLAARVAAAMSLYAEANDRLALAAFDRVTLAAVPAASDGTPLPREARMRAMEGAAATVATVQAVPQNVRSFIQACLMNPSSPVELGSQIATTVTGASPRDWDDHVAARHLADLETTARAFRRVSDLARARESYQDGDRSFRAYAVTMTAADGRTVDRTVTLTGSQQDDVAQAVHTALEELGHLGDRALDALIAGVTAASVGDELADAPAIRAEDEAGQRGSRKVHG